MPYAVELYFDGESEHEIEQLRDVVGRVPDGTIDLRNTHHDQHAAPHISLIVSDGAPPSDLHDRLDRLDWSSAGIVRLAAIGYFADPGVLFLAPSPSRDLLQLHASLYEALADVDRERIRPYYRPDSWMPHCTLGMPFGAEEVADACKRLAGRRIDIHARIASVGTWSLERHRRWHRTISGSRCAPPARGSDARTT